jgi:hypothetical protein
LVAHDNFAFPTGVTGLFGVVGVLGDCAGFGANIISVECTNAADPKPTLVIPPLSTGVLSDESKRPFSMSFSSS